MKLQGYEYLKTTEQALLSGKEPLQIGPKSTTLSLSVGQIITGEVLSVNGKEIHIGLNQNFLLHALLEKENNYSKGQQLSFEVMKHPNSQTLLLRPLFENLSKDPSLLKALEAANLELNPNTEKMVTFLMNQGMAIDKASLQEVYKDLVLFQNEKTDNLSDILKLHQLGVPVTVENLNQLSISNQFQQVMLESIQLVSKQIMKVINPDILSQKNEMELGQTTSNQQVPLPKEMIDILLHVFKNTKIDLDPEILYEEPEQLSNEIQKKDFLQPNALVKDPLPSEVINLLIRLGFDAQDLSQSFEQEEFYKILQTLAPKLESKPNMEFFRDAKEFIQQDFLKNSIQGLIEKNWFVEPEQVAQKDVLTKLYETIRNQGMELLKQLETKLDQQHPLMKSVRNIVEHVDFINHLNQSMQYLEIPLRRKGMNAQGDLYVYTNKKSLAKKEGPITAHLSLHMEHLGQVEVQISLERNKVTNDFLLETEELMNFIEEHMSLLDERLKKRGYEVSSVVHKKEDKSYGLSQIFNEEEKKTVIAKYSFDVRA
jgi:hypothetical protein